MTKILCVEDETGLREDLVEALEDEGYEVAAASNGVEGLQMLVRFMPDLIISDCLMPVMTGAEMLQKIRREYPDFADIPVVFLSAHARKEEIEAGMEVGADAYMSKPVDYDELLVTIARILENGAPSPAPALGSTPNANVVLKEGN
jgi:CheY-like chemotaxis protein